MAATFIVHPQFGWMRLLTTYVNIQMLFGFNITMSHSHARR